MNKIKYFNTEINYIKNEVYREDIKFLINLLPDYFFQIPASSTGKYHPKFTLGDSGLVRHVKVAVLIAKDLLSDPSIGDKYSDDEKDLMLMALILHDDLKSGLTHNRYTQVDHPTLIKNYIIDNKDKLKLSADELKFVGKVIESHMGPWNTDYNGNEVLEKPHNKYQKFVHMCDFLSSKKFLNVKFEGNEIVK